mmetsp:Transcript_8988/g.14261  ORF Transcript_8988/g.14261 Transcript_8988/m.14261 type:complete len:265 (-) Transcript_8988:13-807(-)
MRWVCLSLICSMITFAPLRWLASLSCSRTSYIFRAFRRSISIMASKCRSSSSLSDWTFRFSCICASRMVTTFEYSIIWFMCFTSSMSSSSICFARSRTLFLEAGPSLELSDSMAFFLRSSSIWRIFSLRACDFCMRSSYSSSLRLLCSISSSLDIILAASRRRFSSEAAMTTASCLGALLRLWGSYFFRTCTVSFPTIVISFSSPFRAVLLLGPKRDSSMSAPWLTVRYVRELLRTLLPPTDWPATDPGILSKDRHAPTMDLVN